MRLPVMDAHGFQSFTAVAKAGGDAAQRLVELREHFLDVPDGQPAKPAALRSSAVSGQWSRAFAS
jgi:hypothetical protein